MDVATITRDLNAALGTSNAASPSLVAPAAAAGAVAAVATIAGVAAVASATSSPAVAAAAPAVPPDDDLNFFET
jgi:hypothetical protein